MRRLVAPRPHSVLYPRVVVARGYTKIYFGENQISASLISLLLLSTAHPPSLQPRWVRASTNFYIRFTLAMDSSLAFGSAPCYQFAQLTLAFAMASPLKGLTEQHSATRRLIIQKARRHTSQASFPKEGHRSTPQPEAGAASRQTDANGAPTACKYTVSGSISPTPKRLAFHLSLTLLLRYRSPSST